MRSTTRPVVPRHELDELRAEHDAGNTEEIDGARHEVLRR